ncbi:DUF2341 domain-containing protein [Thermococcus barossii]|uniref:DUF2341 domain-containing protein n=1 Tax=Thermococcus barossii TaxID=54077 RepID=A0A2Z2MNK1_9EURY|nr:DUF2341 domain-containing protein [Thermococcus barossii]ASJ05424.1 hypothetical protein A3L01_08650 [Thermococcus barossii]
MPRHPIVGKLKIMGLVFILVFALALVPAFSVPSIELNVQPIGSCTAEKYYIDVNVTNLEGSDLVNYTFNITIPASRVLFYPSLTYGNVYVVDGDGNPLYYWVMRRTRKVLTVFFRVPYLPANGWRVVRIYYGSDNPYRRYRKPKKLFVYFEPFNRLGTYEHVDTGIFLNSQVFGDGELSVSRGKLKVNSTISTWIFSEAKEARLTTLVVDDEYRIVFKFRRASNSQGAESYPFYMFIHAKVGRNGHRYDYIGIHEDQNSKFHFEFGNDNTGTYESSSRAGKQYYLGEIFVSPSNSTGRVEKFSSGALIDSYVFETRNRFRNREISVGFGQANADFFATVNLLAYIDWVYIVRHADYSAEVIGMGAECSFN